MTVKSNQYDCFPAKTYYYIEHDGYVWHHSDNRWRKKCLKQLWSHGYKSREEAEKELSRIEITPKLQLINDKKVWVVSDEQNEEMFTGSKTECIAWTKGNYPYYYKKGKITVGRVIYDPAEDAILKEAHGDVATDA